MKQVVLPFTPQQALALVQDMDTFRTILIRAYEGDFMTLTDKSQGSSDDSLPLPFDDPLDF